MDDPNEPTAPPVPSGAVEPPADAADVPVAPSQTDLGVRPAFGAPAPIAEPTSASPGAPAPGDPWAPPSAPAAPSADPWRRSDPWRPADPWHAPTPSAGPLSAAPYGQPQGPPAGPPPGPPYGPPPGPPPGPSAGMFPGPAAFGAPPGAPPQQWPGAAPTVPGRAPLTGTRLAVLVGLVSAVVAALVTSIVFVAAGSPSEERPAASAAPGAVPDVARILDETEASVVSVHTGEGDTTSLFGGAGTGVVISDEGLVLTNAHVVNATGGISLTLADGTEVQAELVGSMPDDDIALVQIVDPPSDLRSATLGSSDELEVGDAVVAIGNALNLGGRPTVTTGIVSAKDRTIQAPNLTLRNLLQTDAAINPGNSGGPLLDANGDVVGINTAIISDAQNIGFAIPIDKIRPLIDDIREGNATITLDTAFLGVSTTSVADTSGATLEEYSVDATAGAFVQEVQDGSPADAAGLKVGDVVVAVDGTEAKTSSDVVAAIREHQPGDEITITVERRGERLDLEATVGSRRDLQSSTSTTEPGG